MEVDDARLAAQAYGSHGHDQVRDTFERPLFERAVPRLLKAAGGGRILDLGCGDGLAAQLAGDRLERYLGLDLTPPARSVDPRVTFATHDLRCGLDGIHEGPFDLYLGSFGVASHMAGEELARLIIDIGRHARAGSIVALEALGLYSLEWPGVWDVQPGARRTLPYRLGASVNVHPWSPRELRGLYEAAGIRWLGAADRTLQAAPKTGEGGYWPSLPPLRRALNELLSGDRGSAATLVEPLPPLPAHRAATIHHDLTARRRSLVRSYPRASEPQSLARAVWELERPSSGGFGHGLLAIGRVPAGETAA